MPGAGSGAVEPIVIQQQVPLKIRRRGAELRLILSSENGARPLADHALLRPIARAHRWFNQLLNGQIESIPALAAREGIGVRHVRRIIRLAFLSPEIVEAIAEGRQPLELTAEVLIKQSRIPLSWRGTSSASKRTRPAKAFEAIPSLLERDSIPRWFPFLGPRRVHSRLAFGTNKSHVSGPEGGSRQLVTEKGKAKLARVTAIRNLALRLIERQGHWEHPNKGPETMRYEDPSFLMLFYVRSPIPIEFRRKFNLGPLAHGLYTLEAWEKGVGKILNLSWDSVGAAPRTTTFRRGDWENVFVP